VVGIEVGIGTEAGLEFDIGVGISVVEAVPLEHSTHTSAVVPQVVAAAADGVEDDDELACSSHSASPDWHQETCYGAFSGLLPQAAPCRSSSGSVGG
jgi:hypothetical protein